MSSVDSERPEWLNELVKKEVEGKASPQSAQESHTTSKKDQSTVSSEDNKTWKVFRNITTETKKESSFSLKELMTLKKNCHVLLQQEKAKGHKELNFLQKIRQQYLLAKTEGQYVAANKAIIDSLKETLLRIDLSQISEDMTSYKELSMTLETLYGELTPTEWRSFVNEFLTEHKKEHSAELLHALIKHMDDSQDSTIVSDFISRGYELKLLGHAWQEIEAKATPGELEHKQDQVANVLYEHFAPQVKNLSNQDNAKRPKSFTFTFTFNEQSTSESFKTIEAKALALAIQKHGFKAPLKK